MIKQQGFTLIELMVAMMIIAILVSIALPSYERYVIRNAEAQAQAELQNIALQLERWKASALTYRGFEPIRGIDANGQTIYGFDDPVGITKKGTILFIPLGSNADNARYIFELIDASKVSTDEEAINQRKSLSLKYNNHHNDVVLGNAWLMKAYPNSSKNRMLKGARIFALGSDGYRCAYSRGGDAFSFININAGRANCPDAQRGFEAW